MFNTEALILSFLAVGWVSLPSPDYSFGPADFVPVGGAISLPLTRIVGFTNSPGFISR
jgi:hypothetical protein